MFYNKPPQDPNPAAIFTALCYCAAGLSLLIGWTAVSLSFACLATFIPIHFVLALLIWGSFPRKTAALLETGLEIFIGIALGVGALYGVLFALTCVNLSLIFAGTLYSEVANRVQKPKAAPADLPIISNQINEPAPLVSNHLTSANQSVTLEPNLIEQNQSTQTTAQAPRSLRQ